MTTSLDDDSRALAATYDRVSDHQLESGKRLVARLVGDRPAGQRLRVLDVGCGTGRLASWMSGELEVEVVGLDPLPDRVALARARAPGLRFEVGQAEDLALFEAESFDLVVMSAVFHWIPDKPRALAETRRVLRPGGKLGVTTLPRELMGAGGVAQVLGPLLARPAYAADLDLSKLPLSAHGATTTEILGMLLVAELRLLELHVVARSRTHTSGADAVDFLESSSFGNFFRMVPEALRPKLREELVLGLEARRGPDGVVLRDWGTSFVAERSAV